MYYFKWNQLAILDWFNQKKFWKNHLCSMTKTTKYLPLVGTVFSQIFHTAAQRHQPHQNLPEVGIWDKFELSMTNDKNYNDPFRDVTLKAHLKSPEGGEVDFWGFYDGESTWKFRFSPNEYGRW